VVPWALGKTHFKVPRLTPVISAPVSPIRTCSRFSDQESNGTEFKWRQKQSSVERIFSSCLTSSAACEPKCRAMGPRDCPDRGRGRAGEDGEFLELRGGAAYLLWPDESRAEPVWLLPRAWPTSPERHASSVVTGLHFE